MTLLTEETGPTDNTTLQGEPRSSRRDCRSFAEASGLAVCILLITLFSPTAGAEDKTPTFRTDDSPDKSLPWYEPVKGQFPPEGSAHYIVGELIQVDHTERELHIRVDRNDSQSRAVWDLPLLLTMLPYGSIYYNGRPAALQDIPLGTHLHTWCYPIDPDDQRPPLARWHNRISPESEFRQCIRIEDDFSYHARRNQVWRINSLDLNNMKLTATLMRRGGVQPQHEEKPSQDASDIDLQPAGKPQVFDLTSSTVVYQASGFGRIQTIKSGQYVQMNLTWATLYGPGRVFQIWLDEKSRKLASDRQLERHRNHIRERGIPGWVDAVDDDRQVVTVTFFDGLDTSLFKDFGIIVPEPLGWPTSGGARNDLEPKGTLAVARRSLMTYEPLNDRKGGNILKISKAPVRPGSSGVQIQVECGLLLEGYRPGEVVRFFPAAWKFIAVPKEEQFFGRE